jgi:hypothetical protein
MTNRQWPDPLQRTDPVQVQRLLGDFWQHLQQLPDLLLRHEHLLAHVHLNQLRNMVIELMLARNGVQWPSGTTHLNSYLGESQRTVLERTLLLPGVRRESWIGCAVALVVIYRWYAPQLVEQYHLAYPQDAEEAALAHLQQQLADWPLAITTDPPP